MTVVGAISGAFAAHNKKALFTEVELLYHSISSVSRAFLNFFTYLMHILLKSERFLPYFFLITVIAAPKTLTATTAITAEAVNPPQSKLVHSNVHVRLKKQFQILSNRFPEKYPQQSSQNQE